MVRLRLRRVGSRKNPIWRIVVADRRSPRDGRVANAIRTLAKAAATAQGEGRVMVEIIEDD